MAISDATTKYSWQGLTFVPPADLNDQSVLQFVGDPPAYNLVVTRESLGGAALPVFLQARVRELSTLFPSFALLEQSERKLGPHNCSIIRQSVTTPDGVQVEQIQAYVEIKGEASIFTATTPATDPDWAKKTIDAVLDSLIVEE